jgi:putative colanic acid biosynthesis acetyltransferase WcaF
VSKLTKKLRECLFGNAEFDRGRALPLEIMWLMLSGVFVESWLPGSAWRVWLLRMFGARIEQNVTIKPRVKIKFPWRLDIGKGSSLGEKVWIDNLARVSIGENCCISQDAYLCTGSHDWRSVDLPLTTREIVVERDCWICARAVLAPGTVVRKGSVVGLASAISGEIPEHSIVRLDIAKLNLMPRPAKFESGEQA